MKRSEKRLEEHIPLSGSTAPKEGEGMTLSPHRQQNILVLRSKPKPSAFGFLTKSLLFRGCFRQVMRTEGGRQKKNEGQFVFFEAAAVCLGASINGRPGSSETRSVYGFR